MPCYSVAVGNKMQNQKVFQILKFENIQLTNPQTNI